MNTALVSTWQTTCGIAAYTESLRNGLAGANVATTVWPIDRPALATKRRPELVAAFSELAGAAAKSDVVHLQHEFGLLAGRFGMTESLRVLAEIVRVLDRSRTPLVITWHSEPLFADQLPRRPRAAMTWLFTRATWRATVGAMNASRRIVHIAHTARSAEALMRSGVARERVVVIPHGARPYVSHPISDARRAELRSRFGVPREATLLAIFGFVERYKGYDTALGALERLPPEYHLLIAGGPHPLGRPYELARIRAWQADHPAAAHRVHISGYIADAELPDVLQVPDVLLSPYHATPTLSASGAITAALASGRPVIASAIPAFVDVWERSRALYLVPPEDPGALAGAISAAAEDADVRAALLAGARDYCSRFGWPAVARQHARVYEATLAR